MRQLKRFLIFVLELTVILAGLSVSSLMAGYVGSVDDFFAPFAPFGFVAGLVLTLMAFRRLRRRTRPWKIKYNADGWALARIERKLNPVRARRKRIAERVAVCIPAAIAALVLLFFPVATHFVHPSARYFGHYRVPIPWTQTVFSGPMSPWDNCAVLVLASSSGRGRFGLTPLTNPFLSLREEPLLSSFTFFSCRNEPRSLAGASLPREEDTTVRQFHSPGLTIECRQRRSRYPSRFWPASEPIWYIFCEASLDLERRNAGQISVDNERDHLAAEFTGLSADIPTFYKIIEGIRPIT